MTGLHTGHTPIRGNLSIKGGEGQTPLPADTYTLGKMFRQAGYATGIFGKWGLGGPDTEGEPLSQGFDEFYGYNCQALAHKYYPEHLWHNGEKVILEGNDLVNKVHYSHDLIHRQALDFIRERSDKPIFAMLTYTLPHAEIINPEDSIVESYRGQFVEKPFVAKKKGDYSPEGRNATAYCSQPEPYAQFAAMVTRLDESVGQVVALLEELGLREQTVIVFSSDNGPHTEGGANPAFFESSGPLRGVKRDLYEGGIRVPMIASCPSVIEQGVVSDHVSAFWDIMPTFAEMVGVELPGDTDGVSLLPTLLGKSGQKQHEYLYWEFHEKGGGIAVRMGNWKGIRYKVSTDPASPLELYDLSKDIHEDNNIAAEHPLIVEQIETIMNTARTDSPLFKF
jgi:arylsulfatase A-like enzyme